MHLLKSYKGSCAFEIVHLEKRLKLSYKKGYNANSIFLFIAWLYKHTSSLISG